MTIPRRHQPLSVGALQHPGRGGVRLAPGLTFAGVTIPGGIVTLHLLGRSVSVNVERGESTQSVGRKLRAALKELP